MTQAKIKVANVDPIWDRVRDEAEALVKEEPRMSSLVYSAILNHRSLESVLGGRIAMKLACTEMPETILRDVARDAFADDPSVGAAARADMLAVLDRDPACHRLIQPILYFKGFVAVQASRIAHWLWKRGEKDMAYFIQMRTSEVFGVDIHPGAKIGMGLMIDHAHSIVIGETAVVGNDVSMLHSVTLGGTGKADDDRHPKVEDGVLIGAGAEILGNIRIGHCSRIAAGSVVVKEVPPKVTVAGVPAKIIGEAGCLRPSRKMDQTHLDEGE